MPPPASCLSADDVSVWYAHTSALSSDPSAVIRAIAWLQPEERARFERYRFDADRHMFLLGRVMARELVGRALGVAPGAWGWREGPHGRPEIASPETSLRFNIAHSSGLVACALAFGREVGVDVEDRWRRPVEPALVNRYCSPFETADVEAQGDGWHDRFLLYWTLKEAYLKARGIGISVHLSDINFALGPSGIAVGFLDTLAGTDTRWQFDVMHPTDQHLMAVAASTTESVRVGTGLFSTDFLASASA